MTANDEVYIVGVGRFPFGRHHGVSALQMGAAAMREALEDAGINWGDIDLAVGGSNTAKPDSLVAMLGLTGVSFTSVRNGCATGGVALGVAANALRAGQGQLAAVVGFDKHERGAFSSDSAAYGLGDWYPRMGMMVTAQFFAMRTRRYLHDYGLDEGHLAQVAARASRAGAAHPQAWRRQELTVEQILSAPMVADPLTNMMLCQPNEGGAALVRLASLAVRTRMPGSFEVYAPWLSAHRGESPSAAAAAAAFTNAGLDPARVEVAQIQDTDSGSELIALAEIGLCEHGAQAALLDDGATEAKGRLPINTDGGCLASGEPIGASGLRQIVEVTRQLQDRPEGLPVAHRPRVGFTHVYGAPGMSACAVLTEDTD
jgi:acetyl-CoA acetyltransferase